MMNMRKASPPIAYHCRLSVESLIRLQCQTIHNIGYKRYKHQNKKYENFQETKKFRIDVYRKFNFVTNEEIW
jgi:hypothetical protein